MNRLNRYSQPYCGIPDDGHGKAVLTLPMAAPLIRTAIRCSQTIRCGSRSVPAGPTYWNGHKDESDADIQGVWNRRAKE